MGMGRKKVDGRVNLQGGNTGKGEEREVDLPLLLRNVRNASWLQVEGKLRAAAEQVSSLRCADGCGWLAAADPMQARQMLLLSRQARLAAYKYNKQCCC